MTDHIGSVVSIFEKSKVRPACFHNYHPIDYARAPMETTSNHMSRA